MLCRSELPEPSDSGEPAAALASEEEWFGTPDPSKYAPGTNVLTPQQLEEERSKGNIMTRRDMRLMLEQAEDWELEVRQLQLQRMPQEGCMTCKHVIACTHCWW
jgi:hypothetical protein